MSISNVFDQGGEKMKNKVVIVTGGSSGMGKYMAKKFHNEGAKVVITGRNEERLDEAKKEISSDGSNILSVAMDVRNPEDVDEWFKSQMRHMDVLIS